MSPTPFRHQPHEVLSSNSHTMSPVTELKVHRGWPGQGTYVWSPFVVKLEARLRFANVPYTTGAGGPRGAPKGKIPYVEFQQPQAGGGTVQMGDSTLIARHLVDEGVLPDLNGKLSPEDRARDLATRALLEEKLCFYHTRERWLDHYYIMRDHALSSIPWPMRVLVGQMVYRSHKAMLYGQGTLRLSDEEVRTAKTEIWDTINGVLVAVRSSQDAGPPGDAASRNRPFWFLGGDEPTEVDTTLFGMIVSVLSATAGPESQSIVRGYPMVVEYAERIHATYFPDYEKWP
ncbi:hypothetical protein KVR01_006858 [Diaporthe batatas]|uniref:uncharacterized protein n=1 Tax=Diaporthe batatas TaxID=748121 RepID=UPI001D047E42|nr:uncharacterized protein KVR01_006858 [Diaporthe batatas]KAG8163561.1 hypothetical protein KVR01_006858 [Diaporthe batatas]